MSTEVIVVEMLSTLAEQYLTERVGRRELGGLAARNCRSTLRVFVRTIGDKSARSLTTEDVDLWLSSRAHLAAATRRAQWSSLRLFLAWCRRHGHMVDDPIEGIPSPRQPRSVPRALNQNSVARLLAVCPDARSQAILWLMVGAALRCVEVSRLEVGDWDRERQVLSVRGKGGHERILPVPTPVGAALRQYLRESPAAAGPLIRSYREPSHGLTPDGISGMVSEWMRAARIKRLPRDGVSAHALRHTAASDVLDACGDLTVVQEMLGHTQLSSTSIYLRRASLGKMRKAMGGRRYEDAPESASGEPAA